MIKKSKVIVPALFTLVLTTAASISGTVAWFTANRTYTANIGDFNVTALDGNLACSLTGGIGTTVSGEATANPGALTIDADAGLTNSTYDPAAHKIYANDTGDTSSAGNYADKGTENESNWTYTTVDGVNYYYAYTWTMTFSYTFATDDRNVSLFFDASTSEMVKGDAAGTSAISDDSSGNPTTKDVRRGFRIAMSSTVSTTDYNIVWADHQVSANMKYWNGSSVALCSSAANTKVIDSAYNTAIPASSIASAHQGNNGYLGAFVKDSVTSIAVKCVAYFEGSDPNIVTNAQIFQAVKATMKFGISIVNAA